jgi:flagellar hook-associated protein 3 FlgL
MEEGVLGSVVEGLQRVRELAIQGNDGVLTNTQRAGIAGEVRERLAQILGLANSTDANNDYLFSGHQTRTRPFDPDNAGGFVYSGDQGQRMLQISRTTQIAVGDPGADVFMKIRDGNGQFSAAANAGNTGTGVIGVGGVVDPAAWDGHTYSVSFADNGAGERVYLVRDDTAGSFVDPPSGLADDAQVYQSAAGIVFRGVEVFVEGTPAVGDSFRIAPSVNQDVFTTVQDLALALERTVTGEADRAVLANDINAFLNDIDQALDKITSVRAQVGARLNTTESQQNINADFSLYAEENLSRLQDLDYTEASSRLQLQLLTYQATQQSYALVQGLSLFEFI